MRIPHTLLFGEGFYQDAEVFRINKASIPRLTATPNNSAQSLFVGLLLLASTAFVGVLQDQNGEVLMTDQNEPLEFDNSPLYELLKVSLWGVLIQTKFGVPVITHSMLFEVYASPEIPYDVPIRPDDL